MPDIIDYDAAVVIIEMKYRSTTYLHPNTQLSKFFQYHGRGSSFFFEIRDRT